MFVRCERLCHCWRPLSHGAAKRERQGGAHRRSGARPRPSGGCSTSSWVLGRLGYCRRMPCAPSSEGESVRVAEVIAALSLATDLGMALPLGHGLQSTVIAMRLADRLGVDSETASQTYYACLLFYVGCTANADVAAELFGADDALTRYASPARFGSRAAMVGGFLRAVAPPGGAPLVRARQLAHGLPRVALVFKEHLAAFCEVAQMLTDRLGVPAPSGPSCPCGRALGWQGAARSCESGWAPAAGADCPRRSRRSLPAHAGRRGVRRPRHSRAAGHAFDPAIAALLVQEAADILAVDVDARRGTRRSPSSRGRIDAGGRGDRQSADRDGRLHRSRLSVLRRALRGSGRTRGRCGRALPSGPGEVAGVRRAGLVHDVGRVAVPVRIWQKPGRLTADEWERVRLHPYFTERVLARSRFLAGLARAASAHHERMDGSGYHRGLTAATLTLPARLLAAADAYHAMTEPRPHRSRYRPSRPQSCWARRVAPGSSTRMPSRRCSRSPANRSGESNGPPG